MTDDSTNCVVVIFKVKKFFGYFFDSEDDYRTRYRNVSYCQKQSYLALCNVNPVGGRGVRARGGDLMSETIPPVGLLIMPSDPGVGTFDFDQQKPGIPGINSEAVTKSVP